MVPWARRVARRAGRVDVLGAGDGTVARVATAVLRREGRLDPAEWRFLSTGGVLAGEARPNPAASWLPQSAWLVLFNLGQLPAFQQLVRKLAQEQAVLGQERRRVALLRCEGRGGPR